MKELSKLLTITVICLLFLDCSKTKVIPNSKPAPSIMDSGFELMRNGVSLVTSVNDSVKVSYVQNGMTKFNTLRIAKLQVSATDTTTSKKYNGLVISDDLFIGNSSLGNGAIHNFTIYLNGKAMGDIYFDYLNVKNTTFNNTAVSTDASAFYYFYCAGDSIWGNPIILLPVINTHP